MARRAHRLDFSPESAKIELMNDQNQRIAQFQKMANDDPGNELGHFSLGKAYLEAGRPGDAVPSLKRVIDLRRSMSKAYQLLGDAFEKLGRRDEAAAIMREGVGVADELGDVMPRDAMIRLLESWGETIPALKASTATTGAATTGSTSAAAGFRCSRCGRPDSQLPKPRRNAPPQLRKGLLQFFMISCINDTEDRFCLEQVDAS